MVIVDSLGWWGGGAAGREAGRCGVRPEGGAAAVPGSLAVRACGTERTGSGPRHQRAALASAFAIRLATFRAIFSASRAISRSIPLIGLVNPVK
ncbi:hypothetical protein SCALM49S_07704 [Streptomyces californicus]